MPAPRQPTPTRWPTAVVSSRIVDRRLGGQVQAALRDVDRLIPDPLQIVVDLECRDYEAEIDRHRLVQGEQFEAFLLDLDLLGVDIYVALDDVLRHGCVTGLDRAYRPPKMILHHGTEGQERRLELLGLSSKVGCHFSLSRHQPKRPVM